MEKIITVTCFDELYEWLANYSDIEDFVWVNAKRGKPNGKDFSYIDAVYCALCFGWIDSTCKNIDGVTYQKLMPRGKKTHWTYLNIARCEYLIKKGLMKDRGLKALPDKYKPFIVSNDILIELKKNEKAWNNFSCFPVLYQRVRVDNIEWARKNNELFRRRLNKLIKTAENNEMYGQWDDYDRLKILI